MSKIPGKSDGLNDADLASLFSSDTSQPPKDLDKLILNSAQVSQHDLLPQQRKTFTQQYAPLFAIAAVLMIAIGLTPLTMNAPESQPDLALGPAPTPESIPLATTTDSGVRASISKNSVEARESETRISTAESNIQVPTAESSSAEPESIAAVSTAVAPTPEDDSDATGIDADENMTYETEPSNDKQIPLVDIRNEEELILNNTDDGVEKTDAPGVIVAEPTDTVSTMKEGPSPELAAEVGKIELQKSIVNLQDNEAKQQNKIAASALTQAAQDILDSARANQAQELSLITEQESAQAVKPARVKAKNYRSSALLWVIEIKHLYKENLIEEAKEELTLFRKKFPDNDNERLLPTELLDTKPD